MPLQGEPATALRLTPFIFNRRTLTRKQPIMKSVLSIAVLVLASSVFASDRTTHGYTKKDGTQVESYHHSESNRTKDDNYSTRGNVNPETGKKGTKSGD